MNRKELTCYNNDPFNVFFKFEGDIIDVEDLEGNPVAYVYYKRENKISIRKKLSTIVVIYK